MKRYLPLLIIVGVALITTGAATMFYRAKMGAPAVPARTAASNAPGATGAATASRTPRADEKLAHARGPADAPVTLEIYGDFQCPACATASAAVDELMKNYGDKVRLVFHEFPLSMHAHSVEAAMAAEAAGVQGKFWPMHDRLYDYQKVWSKISNPARFFAAYAQSLGMDLDQFQKDQRSDELKRRIIGQGEAGVARGVKNTPTIFVNDVEMRGTFSREEIKSEIDSALGKGSR